MNLRCFFYSCKEVPDFLCQCEKEPTYICVHHMNNHFSFSRYKAHNHLPTFREFNPNIKPNLLDTLNKMIKKNNEMKKKLLDGVENVIKISNSIIKYIQDLNRLLVFNFTQISVHNRVMMPLFKEENTYKYNSELLNVNELEAIKLWTINEFKNLKCQIVYDSFFKTFSEVIKCNFKAGIETFNQNNNSQGGFFNSQPLSQGFINSPNTIGTSGFSLGKLPPFTFGKTGFR